MSRYPCSRLLPVRLKLVVSLVLLCGMAGLTKDFAMAQDDDLDPNYDLDPSDDPSFDVGGGQKMKVKLAEAKAPRYLLYDVNHGEGFNLRRDVYMRLAVMVKQLNEIEPWILVLPAWGRVYHWKSQDLGYQTQIPWATFFDMDSLRRFVPVMEFEDFLKITPSKEVGEVYYLQHYAEGWDKWEEKIDKRPCINKNMMYHFDKTNNKWYGWFFDYEDVWTSKFECVSVMGHAGFMIPFLRQNTTARSVMLDRAETVLHDRFGDSMFWQVRRSMRFAQHLRDIGDEFRKKKLDSTDEKDKTVIEEDWTKMKKSPGSAVGGPYLGVHLRRADFVHVRSKDIPSLSHAATQISQLMEKLGLEKIFIATDAPKKEYEELKSQLEQYKVYRYKPKKEVKEKYKDGGVAIIDQWIAAHARYFIGSKESTFSFRIQDEREILGFDADTTFNRLCNDNDKECEQPSRWKVVY